jgi:Glyoxalase-like domain
MSEVPDLLASTLASHEEARCVRGGLSRWTAGGQRHWRHSGAWRWVTSRLPHRRGSGVGRSWLVHFGVPPDEWDDGAYIQDPDGVLPAISFMKVPEPKVVKNRVHLDVQAGGGRGEPWDVRWPRVTRRVEELVAAGATVIREDVQNGKPDHVVMADPEGNEFCVL